jgi:hypothetical protein
MYQGIAAPLLIGVLTSGQSKSGATLFLLNLQLVIGLDGVQEEKYV